MEKQNYDIIIKPSTNKGYVIIKTNHFRVWENLQSKFTFKADNYWFSPKYKDGTWDGKIRKLKYDGSLPIGLLDHLIEKIVPKYNYTVLFDNYIRTINYDVDKIKSWIDGLNISKEPRDYQFNAFYEGICKKLNGIISITGSGKSLMIYLFCRFALQIKKQVLLVVPRVQLVDQMYKDFIDYGFEDIDEHCYMIKAGKAKDFIKPIIITTWQSVYKKATDNYKNIGMLIVDECHEANAKSLVTIQDNCYNASYRFGLSGTVPINTEADYFTYTSCFGVFKEYLTYQEATEKGYISPMVLNVILLDYQDKDRKLNYELNRDYQDEIDFVYNHKERNIFLAQLVDGLEKNTLILFTKIETHGKVLLNIIKEYSKKEVYYIDGSVKDTVREDIRAKMELEDNVILLASYGTFSIGINIKNIHNVVFASAYRTEIKTFQSIGRGLRKLDDKTLQVYDIVDQLSYQKDNGSIYDNHIVNQFRDRLEQYKKRDFSIIKKRIEL